ncbi:MAG: hypothetical protein ACRDGW_03130 [Actinomycetota bacterium]
MHGGRITSVGANPPYQSAYRGVAPPACSNGKQGTELAEVIVEKIKSAVNAITFN